MKVFSALVALAAFTAAAFAFNLCAGLDSTIVTKAFTEKDTYAVGEQVNVTVVVTNEGPKETTLWFPTNLVAYYIVVDIHDEVVFDLRKHVYVLFGYTQFVIAAGESVTYVFDGADAWAQVDDDNKSVPCPEEYTIRGLLDMEGGYVIGETVVQIGSEDDVAPEPPETDVVTEVFTEKDRYSPGEPINVTVVVTNLGEESVTYDYRSSCHARYVVESEDGARVFEYIATDLPVIQRTTLEPGESETYVFDGYNAWDQVDDRGYPVEVPGSYIIYGILNTWDYPTLYVLDYGFLTETQPYLIGSKTVAISEYEEDPGDSVLSTEVSTERPSYAPGEAVNVTVKVTNPGANYVTVEYMSYNLCACYVVKDSQGEVVFDLRKHTYSDYIPYSVTLSPGESEFHVFYDSMAWGQVDDDGLPVDRGASYTVEGLLATWAPYEPSNATVTLSEADDDDEPLSGTESGPSTVMVVVAVAAVAAIAVVLLMSLKRRNGPRKT